MRSEQNIKILVASIFGVYRRFLPHTLHWWGFLVQSCHMMSKLSVFFYCKVCTGELFLHDTVFLWCLRGRFWPKPDKCHTDKLSLRHAQSHYTKIGQVSPLDLLTKYFRISVQSSKLSHMVAQNLQKCALILIQFLESSSNQSWRWHVPKTSRTVWSWFLSSVLGNI